jgi:hydrogenase nickel incorporation protein HypA/HybF
MHEFSLSSDIVQTVISASEENRAKKVLSIQLDVGELALVNVEQVTFWLKELFKGTPAEGAKIKVKRVRARIGCDECGYQGGTKSEKRNAPGGPAPCSCPQCGSFRIHIKKGREFILRNIEAVR